MNNILMWVAGAFALALAALFAVPPIIDWNQYRGVFEEEVSRLLGREVRVGGRVNLRILPVPYVRFEKVRIADAPGIPGSFIRVENFTMLLSVPPLLRGVVEARQLELDGMQLRLRFDENGGGNWQKLNIRQQDLAFVPSDFALQSAMVRGGSIVFESHNGREITRFDGINGELVAGALRGPYRFNGQARIAGRELGLRFATAAMDRDGGLVLTATADNPETQANYTLKGRLSDLETMPRLIGEFHSRAPLRLGAEQAAEKTTFYDLRAKATVDHASAELGEVVVSFDTAGRPQQLTGQLRATWPEELQIKGRLTSKWLDLDAITGGRTTADPLRVFSIMSAGTASKRASNGASEIDFVIEQANLGGQVASALAATLVQAGDELRVERVRANLPGEAKLHAGGSFTEPSGIPTWQGHAVIRGSNFASFSEWMWPGRLTVAGSAAGKFGFSAEIITAPTAFEVSDAAVEIAGRTSRGSVKYNWSKKPLLTVDWSADSVDLSGFGGRVLSNESLGRLFGLKPGADGEPGALQRQLRTADVDLRLQAGAVSDAQRTFTDVDLLLSRTGNQLRLGKSRMTVEPGLMLELEGAVDQLHREPEWNLTGLVEVRSDQALQELRGIIADLSSDAALPEVLTAMHPMRLALTANSMLADGKRETRIDADGSLHTERVRLNVVTHGSIQDWRRNKLQLDAKIDGLTTRTVAMLMRGRSPASGARHAGAGAGRQDTNAQPSILRLSMIGIPEQELRTSATLVSDIWRMHMEGRSQPGKAGEAKTWTGTGHAEISNAGHVAGLFEPRWKAFFPQTIGAGGRFQFERTTTGWLVEPIDFGVAGSKLTGDLVVSRPDAAEGDADSPLHLSGTLSVDHIETASLLGPLMPGAAPRQTRNGDDADPAASLSYWPDRPFDLGVLSLLKADLRLTVRRLELAPELLVSNASLALKASDGRLSLEQAEGQLLAGKVTGKASLRAAPAGVLFDGALALSDASVDRLVSPQLAKRAAGRFGLTLQATGQALSPRALVTALRGSGQLDFAALRVPGLQPATLTGIADAVVIGEAPPDELNQQLVAALANGSVRVGNSKAELKIADGALLVGKIARRIGPARLVNQTTIDLVRMGFDSQWQVDTVLKRALEPDLVVKPLPPVQVVYAGLLADLSRLEPAVSTGDLQRELTVQRMEHDVRRLERLRKEDEERARAEAERLRQLELDQQRALEEEARKRGELPAQQPAADAQGGAGTVIPPASGSPVSVQPGGASRSAIGTEPGATPAVSREQLPAAATSSATQGQAPAAADASASGPQQSQVTPPPQQLPPPKPRKVTKPWNPFSDVN